MFLAFLTSRWGIAAAVAVAMGIWIGVLEVQLGVCKSTNADLAVKATAMAAQISEQNRAVEALRVDSERKREASEKALAEAKKKAGAVASEVKRLRALAAEKPSGKTCHDAWSEIRRP